MQRPSERNSRLEGPDLFTAVNNYYLLFFAASCILASLYLQQLFAAVGLPRAGIALGELLAIVGPVYLLMHRSGPGFRRQIRLAPPRLSRLWLVVAATLALVVLVDQVYLLSQRLWSIPDSYLEGLERLRPTGAGSFALVFGALCVVVPIAEELVFRGIIQRVFTRNMGAIPAFVLAGLVFGAAHFSAHLLVSVSVFGVFLGFVFMVSSNLTYTIVSHAVFNLAALLQLTYTTGDGDLPFYLRDARVAVAAAVLMVLLLARLKSGGPETEPPNNLPN